MFETIDQCNFAIKDIDETLEIWRGHKDMSDPYIQKLYNQRDQAIEAKQKLQKKKPCITCGK